MIHILFTIPKDADLKSVSRRVRYWADRKKFGISWSINKTLHEVDVNFSMHDATIDQIENAAAGLKRILARCAPAVPVLPRVPETDGMPKPQFINGSRVLTRRQLKGTVIARFEDVGRWTYVVAMDRSFESPVHFDQINRAVFAEEFLTHQP